MQKVERSTLEKATVAGGCCKSSGATATSTSTSTSTNTITIVVKR